MAYVSDVAVSDWRQLTVQPCKRAKMQTTYMEPQGFSEGQEGPSQECCDPAAVAVCDVLIGNCNATLHPITGTDMRFIEQQIVYLLPLSS